MSHYTLPKLVELPESSSDLTLSKLMERAARDFHSDNVTIEFSRDVIRRLVCPECCAADERFAPVGSISFHEGRCANDGQMRVVETIHGFSGRESFGARTLDALGLPLFDAFTARSGEEEIGYLIAGDRRKVLGSLCDAGAR